MKNLIFTTYYILLTISVFSQTTFSKIYNPKGYATIGIETFQINNNGYSFNNVSLDSTSGYYHNRVILKIDKYGNELDTLIIEIKNKNLYGTGKVLELTNQFLFSGGIAFPNHAASYIIFTDSNFTKTKQIIYGDTVGSTYTFLSTDDGCLLTSGDMMFCGEEYDTTTTSGSKIQLTKTDRAGNRIWKKN